MEPDNNKNINPSPHPKTSFFSRLTLSKIPWKVLIGVSVLILLISSYHNKSTKKKHQKQREKLPATPIQKNEKLIEYGTVWIQCQSNSSFVASKDDTVLLGNSHKENVAWTLVKFPNGKFGFKAQSREFYRDRFLQGQPERKLDLTTNKLEWEQWEIIPSKKKSKVLIRSCHDTYLCIEKGKLCLGTQPQEASFSFYFFARCDLRAKTSSIAFLKHWKL